MNRKLIRPNLSELKDKLGIPAKGGGGEVMTPAPPALTAPEQTNAESFYYLKQMQSKTPMVIVLQDDEKVRGVIEWYDKHCLKINRVKEPNVLVPKHNIKYIYKQEEEPRIRRSRTAKKEEALAAEVELPVYD